MDIIIPIYNPSMQALTRHFEILKALDPSVKEQLRLVIVDDGSKVHYRPVDPPVETVVARIKKDIEWNVSGAMNLGMHLARDGWACFLSEDHVIEPDDWKRVLETDFTRGNIYLLKRMLVNNVPYKKPLAPGLPIIHRADFWELGGYDEDYARGKGYSDWFLYGCPHEGHEYQKRVSLASKAGFKYTLLDIPIVFFPEHSKTRRRGLRLNKSLHDMKLRQLQEGVYKHPSVLNFEWEVTHGG